MVGSCQSSRSDIMMVAVGLKPTATIGSRYATKCAQMKTDGNEEPPKEPSGGSTQFSDCGCYAAWKATPLGRHA